MTDHKNSRLLALPVCPVCLAKMLVSSVFPVIYPSGQRQFSYTFSCDICRVQSSSIRSFVGADLLSFPSEGSHAPAREIVVKYVNTSPEPDVLGGNGRYENSDQSKKDAAGIG